MSTAAVAGDLPPVVAIARDILRLGVEARLPTTLAYQERLGVGSGTVQKAIKELREAGAVDLVSRGHMGTFITALDPVRLWQRAGLRPVHVLLPPSGPIESLAVAAALAECLAAFGAGTTIGYQRGAQTRLAAVDAEDADLAVMSQGAASDLAGYTRVGLGPGTYYAPGSLVTVSRSGGEGAPLAVGIDPRSGDHQRLTHAEFDGVPGGVRYVETDFTYLPRAVLRGEVDTGVWHVVDSLIPLDLVGLRTEPLAAPDAVALEKEISSAVLAARDDSITGALLGRIDHRELRTAATKARRAGAEELEARLRVSVR